MSGMKQNMEQWAAAGLPGEGKTTEEILRFIEEYCRDAVQKSKKVICFPELTIAPNPLGVTVYESTVTVSGTITDRLSKICRMYGIYLIVGIAQKSRVPGRVYDEVLVINPVGEILTEYVIHTVDGTRQLYLCGSAYKESYFFNLPFAKAGLLAGGDVFDDELLRQYKDADAIFMCLSDQKEGRDRAASVAERLGKTVILAGLEPGIFEG